MLARGINGYRATVCARDVDSRNACLESFPRDAVVLAKSCMLAVCTVHDLVITNTHNDVLLLAGPVQTVEIGEDRQIEHGLRDVEIGKRHAIDVTEAGIKMRAFSWRSGRNEVSISSFSSLFEQLYRHVEV